MNDGTAVYQMEHTTQPSIAAVIIPTLFIHLSFTLGSKPTFSTNPSHRRFLLPTGLPHDNGTGPDLLRSSFFLVSHFNFLFVPCGRLSWLPVSFLLHVKYPLSYRIVSYLVTCVIFVCLFAFRLVCYHGDSTGNGYCYDTVRTDQKRY